MEGGGPKQHKSSQIPESLAPLKTEAERAWAVGKGHQVWRLAPVIAVFRRWRQAGSVPCHPQLHVGSRATLGYMRFCLKKLKQEKQAASLGKALAV